MKFAKHVISGILRSVTFQGVVESPRALYRHNLLRVMILANLGVSLTLMAYGVYGLIFGMSGSLANRLFTLWALPTLLIIANIFAIWQVRKHNIRQASLLIVGSGWGISLIGTTITGGVYSTVIFGLLLYLVMGTLLLGFRSSAVLYAVTMLSFGVLYVFDYVWELPAAPPHEPPLRVVILWMTASMLFVMVWYHDYAIRQSERLLNSARIRAERYRVQQDLTQNLAHDLRTPITVLTNNAYLIERRAAQGLPINQHITRLNDQAQKISKMLADLALLIDLDSEPAHITHTPLRLVNRLNRVVEDETPYAVDNEITISLHDETDGKATIWGDAPLIERLFENLIENAIHYGKPGGSINIRVWKIEDVHEVAIAIQDDGIGIAPEHWEHIFERYYRVDEARRLVQRQSTGVGLYIVQQIAKRHGGRIELDSTPSVGSTFTVYLPCRTKDAIARRVALTG